MQTTPVQTKRIRLHSALSLCETARTVDPWITMQSLKVFLIIASGAGNRPREISQVGTLTQKTVFWSLRVLGCEELKGNYRPVLRLVEAIVDPEDGRKRLYALTAKGEEFAREIAGAID